jgi:glycosyltransferase involved in cell wall biosynthesis
MSKPKIFVVYSKSGCCYWRTWLPCEEMRKQGLAEFRYLDSRLMEPKSLKENLKWCDIIHIRGLLGLDALDTMRRYQQLGVKVVTDFDDNHFNVSPFNPAYRHFGLEDVQVKDPTTGDVQYLWKDGENGFDIKTNEMKFHAFKAILQEADAVTTTTLYLKKSLSELSGREDNISVVPNAIDFTKWQTLDVREKFPQKFRFGWAVSNSHREDFIFIKSALNDFLKSHPDATFVCLGDAGLDIKTGLPQGQVEWYPFSDLWEGHYQMRMAMLGLDVAIAPLAQTEFNRCKSPLKFAEYAAFGWPVIAQNMEPYSSHIVNGETGLLADSLADWVRCLDSLYSDKSLRAKLAFNAKFAVKEMFDLEKVALEWYQTYNALLLGVVIK